MSFLIHNLMSHYFDFPALTSQWIKQSINNKDLINRNIQGVADAQILENILYSPLDIMPKFLVWHLFSFDCLYWEYSIPVSAVGCH